VTNGSHSAINIAQTTITFNLQNHYHGFSKR
jgi:hypothetical protein